MREMYSYIISVNIHIAIRARTQAADNSDVIGVEVPTEMKKQFAFQNSHTPLCPQYAICVVSEAAATKPVTPKLDPSLPANTKTFL